jgi:hypothetical protein
MNIGGYPTDLLVDTSITHSVVIQPVGSLLQRHETIVRAMGDQTHCPFLISRKCKLGKYEVRHEFLYLPNFPVALMGRDM